MDRKQQEQGGQQQGSPSYQLMRNSVPEPIVTTQQLYFDSLSADVKHSEPGSIEETCRSTFALHFVAATSPCAGHIDDMLWYVRTPSKAREAKGEAVFLLRRNRQLDTDTMLLAAEKEGLGEKDDSKSGSSGSGRFTTAAATVVSNNSSSSMSNTDSFDGGAIIQSPIRWRDTLALNIATQWTYTLSVSVVRLLKVGGKKYPVVIREVSKRVFASPAKAQFQDKEGRADDTIDYPNLYFNIDDFDDVFGGIQLCEGYSFAVLLTAGGTSDSNASIFRGLLSYDIIMQRVVRDVKEKGKYATPESKIFIPLLGPDKKGKAEIAVCVSDAELQTYSLDSSSPGRGDEKSGGGGGGGATGFFKNISNKITGKKEPMPITGNETLQCFLTHVSVNIHHVTSLLCDNRQTTKAQWLYNPRSRKELDDILGAEENQFPDPTPAALHSGSNSSSAPIDTATTSAVASPTTPQQTRDRSSSTTDASSPTVTRENSGGFFSGLKNKILKK